MTAKRNDVQAAEPGGWEPDVTISITVEPETFLKVCELMKDRSCRGPDLLKIRTAPLKGGMRNVKTGKEVRGIFEDLAANIPTAFFPDPEQGSFRFAIGDLPCAMGFDETNFTAEDWGGIVERLIARNAALGIRLPQGKPQTFPVAHGWNPVHQLSQRTRAGMLPFPELSRDFHELRTPLNDAVGMALFASTSEQNPRGWQEVKLADLVGLVFSLAERGAPRRGDHREDVLAELVKLTERTPFVRYDWERRGRYWHRKVALGVETAIPNLELVYLDKKGRPVRPSDPAFRDLAVPLEVKGRRAFAADGSRIHALPKGDFRLETVRWRWNPSFADDLEAAVARDERGRVKLSAGGYRQPAKGKPLRGGFNIRVPKTIFAALARLRAENAFVACKLLGLLARDIAPPRKADTAQSRNRIEREAVRLYDQLGLEDDPKHARRREDAVAAAIFRLKQPDIAALLPGTDERPIPSANPDRRKAAYYRLIRSPEYTPRAALVTDREAAVLKIESAEQNASAGPQAAAPAPEALVIPGMEPPPGPPIPSGADVRAAREAAGVNLRDFAAMIGGPGFSTWARYEQGRSIRTGRVAPECWDKVREFIARHGKGTA